jgi:predicted amidohydrolase YtcJ
VRPRLPLVPALAVLACGCAPTPRADLLITNGMVWTGLSSGPAQPGAVAIGGNKILAAGDSATMARYFGAATRVIDAHGGLVMPGFNDGHTHFIDASFALSSVQLRDAAMPNEFIRRIADYARRLNPGEWITGGEWDHTLWPGRMLPQHQWIDSVTPNNPVVIERLDGHELLANAMAMRLAGVTKETPTPFGGQILHDAKTGALTGVFKDAAMDLVYKAVPQPSAEQMDSALARGLAHAESLGVTGVGYMSATFAHRASFRRMERAGRLTLRAVLYMIEDWRATADTIAADGPGDDWVRIGGMKRFMDGSAGSRTAFMAQPYADSAGYRGLLQNSPADMAELIGEADSAGLQLAIHSIGDSANALLLAMYDSVAQAHGPRDRRFRMEHAQHLRAQDVPKFAAIGVIASMQPYHAIDDGRWLEQRLGPERMHDSYVFRSLLDAHAILAFGSDWQVAPLDPILGVYAAVTRRTLDGKNPDGWLPEQKITLAEALKAYTWGNAYAVFAEQQRGTLAPGMLADVDVLDHDLFTMPPESLATARVTATIVGGKVVFERR